MPPLPQDAITKLRAAVDAGLQELLTSPDPAAQRALSHVQRAIHLLEVAESAIERDAAESIRTAEQHLNAGHWQDARCALITARGRLVHTGTAPSPRHSREATAQ